MWLKQYEEKRSLHKVTCYQHNLGHKADCFWDDEQIRVNFLFPNRQRSKKSHSYYPSETHMQFWKSIFEIPVNKHYLIYKNPIWTLNKKKSLLSKSAITTIKLISVSTTSMLILMSSKVLSPNNITRSIYSISR